MTEPDSPGPLHPPRNVRIVLLDGQEVAVELAYRGRDARGDHLWVSTGTFPHPLAGIHADMIPAHTAIIVRTEEMP